MPRGVLCTCGCRSIITDIDPATNQPYRECEASRKRKAKAARTRNTTQRKHNLNHARLSNGNLIYDTQAWRRLSEKKRTVSPYCEECFNNGKGYVLAEVVDHIIEIKDDPTLAYVFDNLRSLCRACHNTKTSDEKRKRTGNTGNATDFMI